MDDPFDAEVSLAAMAAEVVSTLECVAAECLAADCAAEEEEGEEFRFFAFENINPPDPTQYPESGVTFPKPEGGGGKEMSSLSSFWGMSSATKSTMTSSTTTSASSSSKTMTLSSLKTQLEFLEDILLEGEAFGSSIMSSTRSTAHSAFRIFFNVAIDGVVEVGVSAAIDASCLSDARRTKGRARTGTGGGRPVLRTEGEDAVGDGRHVLRTAGDDGVGDGRPDVERPGIEDRTPLKVTGDVIGARC